MSISQLPSTLADVRQLLPAWCGDDSSFKQIKESSLLTMKEEAQI
jgi:hypothetical protein